MKKPTSLSSFTQYFRHAAAITALVLCFWVPVHAIIRYVKPTAAGSGDGSSWANASADLQAMINASATGDEVWVAAGTYKPASGTNRTISFVLKNGVAIYGGLAGNEAPGYDMSLRNFTLNTSILSGDIDNNDGPNFTNNGGNAQTVVLANSGTNATAILDGFTITAGNANGGAGAVPSSRGGGMYNADNASPTIRYCTFSANTADFGAGLYSRNNASPQLSHCTFTGNTTPNWGGGILSETGGSLTLSHCTFQNNSAAEGGGIYTFSTFTLTNCTISNNTASTQGGGIRARASATLNLQNCVVSDNNTSGFGGGILTFGPANITGTTIHNNQAGNAGGAFFASTLEMTHCAITNNSTVFQGAGINLQNCPNATLTNCLISGNTSQNSHGGILNFNASISETNLYLINCTVAQNTSTNGYAAIWTTSNAYTYLKNTIAAENVPGNFLNHGSLTSQGHNLDSDGTSGFVNGMNGDIVGQAPLFISTTNFRLQACSPAINAGNNAAVPSGITTDLDGNPRFYNSGTVDMGAYEFQDTPTPVVATCQPQTVSLGSMGTASLAASALNSSSTGCGTLTFTVGGQSSLSFACGDIGSSPYTLTVTDARGQTATCMATVTVQDNTPPTFTCPANQNVNLNATCQLVVPNLIGTLTGMDNCGTVSFTQSPAAGTAVASSHNGTVSVTITASDGNGNTSTCSVTLTGKDVTPPTVTCQNTSIAFNGEPSIALSAASLVTASDNCGVASVSLSPSVILCSQIGQTVPVTVTVTDAGGNVSTCTANVTAGGLPCGWSHTSGAVGCPSTASFQPGTGVWTQSATNCFYGPPYGADALSLVQRTLCGNGSITARVTGISPLGSGWAGIVMRESNALGARKVQLMTNLSNFHRREVRTMVNGAATIQQLPANGHPWLRIVRTGNQFAAYTSPNGVAWFFAMAVSIPMPECMVMGLVTTNLTAVGTTSATFDNVSATGNSAPLMAPVWAAPAMHPHAAALPDFSLYPNPSDGQLNLELSKYQGRAVRVEVYRVEGRLVYWRELEEVQGGVEGLDLSGYGAGVYVVKVKSEGLPDRAVRAIVR